METLDVSNSDALDESISEKHSEFRFLGIGKPSQKQITKYQAKGKYNKIDRLVNKGVIQPEQLTQQTQVDLGYVAPPEPEPEQVFMPEVIPAKNTTTQPSGSKASSGTSVPKFDPTSSAGTLIDKFSKKTQSGTQQSGMPNTPEEEKILGLTHQQLYNYAGVAAIAIIAVLLVRSQRKGMPPVPAPGQ